MIVDDKPYQNGTSSNYIFKITQKFRKKIINLNWRYPTPALYNFYKEANFSRSVVYTRSIIINYFSYVLKTKYRKLIVVKRNEIDVYNFLETINLC